MSKATTTTTRATVRLKIIGVLALAVLSGAVILNRCVTLGGLGNTNNSNGNKNTNQSCTEDSCKSNPVSIDVEGATLTLTALSVKDQIIGKLKCPQGELACEVGSWTSSGGTTTCCRTSTYTISSFTFTAEGPGGCTGGGSSTGGGFKDKSCSSKEDGVTQALTAHASHIDQAKCLNAAGKENCGYVVTGSGTITVKECPTCNVESDIKWTKTCKAADVEGFLDKYRIQVIASLEQSCSAASTGT